MTARIPRRTFCAGLTGLAVAGSASAGRPATAGALATPRASALAHRTELVRVEGSTLGAFLVGGDRVQKVENAGRPFAYVGRAALRSPNRPHDADGIVMYAREGRLYDHPVLQSAHLLTWLWSYRNSGDRRYLDLAVRHGERILSYAHTARGALYLPYPFDFPLHGKAEFTMRAPWYSAMAQGQALSAFITLFEVTREARWQRAADDILATFLNPPAAGQPWTVEVDRQQLLWCEEYVGEHVDRAYNGHNFAVYGLYDYWWVTGDARARQLFLGAVQATRTHAADIRMPGRTSKYCLNHEVFSASYHGIHVQQLYKLHTLTGSPDLARLADAFQSDAPAGYAAGRAYLAPGRHSLVTRGTDGRTLTSTRTGPRAAETVRFGLRSWMADRPGCGCGSTPARYEDSGFRNGRGSPIRSTCATPSRLPPCGRGCCAPAPTSATRSARTDGPWPGAPYGYPGPLRR